MRSILSLPAAATVATALAVVLVALAVWSVISVVRGDPVDLPEAVSFAVVFAVVYFGALSILERGGG